MSKSPGRFLSARWQHLVMLNYEVDPAILIPHIPNGVELDNFEGKTYVSVVGFLFLETKLLGLPVPFHRHFPEVNLRYYVKREIDGEMHRAVCFIKEIVPRWAIAKIARWGYNEPYVALPMRYEIEADESPRVSYQWKWQGEWSSVGLQANGAAAPLKEGSVEEFIAEHYYGYTRQRNGGTVEYRVEHPPWNVWQAAESSLNCDIAGLYGEEFVEPLSGPPASAFLADGSPVTVSRPRRIV